MSCLLCGDKGVIRIGYREEPVGWMDFGICQCRVGQRYRASPAMDALAAKYHTDREHVGLVEDLLDAKDLPVEMRQVAAVGDVTEAGSRARTGKKARL